MRHSRGEGAKVDSDAGNKSWRIGVMTWCAGGGKKICDSGKGAIGVGGESEEREERDAKEKKGWRIEDFSRGHQKKEKRMTSFSIPPPLFPPPGLPEKKEWGAPGKK